ncbi:MAG: hypothetical protein FJ096_06970 [Deltaproteobacteria bacterium]|nr:hypothetical protein [Deltaproteobacteria bacterium]
MTEAPGIAAHRALPAGPRGIAARPCGAWLVLFAVGCGGPVRPPPVPPATPPPVVAASLGGALTDRPVVVETTSACTHARARCDLGTCTVELHNECELPILCELTVAASCGPGGNAPSAKATQRESVPVDTATTLDASVDCGAEPPRNTRLAGLRCR